MLYIYPKTASLPPFHRLVRTDFVRSVQERISSAASAAKFSPILQYELCILHFLRSAICILNSAFPGFCILNFAISGLRRRAKSSPAARTKSYLRQGEIRRLPGEITAASGGGDNIRQPQAAELHHSAFCNLKS